MMTFNYPPDYSAIMDDDAIIAMTRDELRKHFNYIEPQQNDNVLLSRNHFPEFVDAPLPNYSFLQNGSVMIAGNSALNILFGRTPSFPTVAIITTGAESAEQIIDNVFIGNLGDRARVIYDCNTISIPGAVIIAKSFTVRQYMKYAQHDLYSVLFDGEWFYFNKAFLYCWARGTLMIRIDKIRRGFEASAKTIYKLGFSAFVPALADHGVPLGTRGPGLIANYLTSTEDPDQEETRTVAHNEGDIVYKRGSHYVVSFAPRHKLSQFRLKNGGTRLPNCIRKITISDANNLGTGYKASKWIGVFREQ